MKLNDFISGISFKYLQPDMPTSPALDKKMIDFELLNTIFPRKDDQMKKRLYEVCKIPRMSTLAVGAIINKAVSKMNDKDCFINVGVWNGFSFLSAITDNPKKRCIGIDNFSEFGSPRKAFLERFSRYKSKSHHFYELDYVDYFKNLRSESIGFYFYDGAHDYENQLWGLKMAEPFFAENCIIMVDDTNWEEPRKATLDFIAGSPNQYKLLLDVTTANNCHPTFWNGLMVFQKKNG